MELIFLGTGAGMPSSHRNVSSMALRFIGGAKSAVWLFDCGEATQHQLMRTPLKLSKLDKIFLTHLHGDHLFGLPGLLTSRAHQGVKTPLQLFGPKGVKAFIECALTTSGSHVGYEMDIVELDQPFLPKDGVPLYEDDEYRVYCGMLDHRIACFGYRIEEKAKPGKLDEQALIDVGIKPGPIYGSLKRGEQVQLEDGRVLDGTQFIGPPVPGRIVAIMGDTRACGTVIELAHGADLLVHEATFEYELADLAREYYHATSVDAAEAAAAAGVKSLIITHLSSRYQEESCNKLLEEARKLFPNTLLADDLATFAIDRMIP